MKAIAPQFPVSGAIIFFVISCSSVFSAAPQIEVQVTLASHSNPYCAVPVSLALRNLGSSPIQVLDHPGLHTIRVQIQNTSSRETVYDGPVVGRLSADGEREPAVRSMKASESRSQSFILSCTHTGAVIEPLFTTAGQYRLRFLTPFLWKDQTGKNGLILTSDWSQLAIELPIDAEAASLAAFRNMSNSAIMLDPAVIPVLEIETSRATEREASSFLTEHGNSKWAPYARLALATVFRVRADLSTASRQANLTEALRVLQGITNQVDFPRLDEAKGDLATVVRLLDPSSINSPFGTAPQPEDPRADAATESEVKSVVQRYFNLIAAMQLDECQNMMTADFIRNGTDNRDQLIARLQKEQGKKFPNGTAEAQTTFSQITATNGVVSVKAIVTIKTPSTTAQHRVRMTLTRVNTQWLIRRWDRQDE